MKIGKTVIIEAYYLYDGFIHLILNDGKERHYKVNVGNGHEDEAIDYINSLPQTASSINEIKNKWDLTTMNESLKEGGLQEISQQWEDGIQNVLDGFRQMSRGCLDLELSKETAGQTKFTVELEDFLQEFSTWWKSHKNVYYFNESKEDEKSAKKNLDSADDKITDVKDTLKEGEGESDKKKSKEYSFDDFLNTTFEIYYGGKKVGTCKGSDFKADSADDFDEIIEESLGDDLDKLKQDLDNMQIGDSVTVKNYENGDIYKFVKRGNNDTIADFENVLGKNHLASKQHVFGWAKDSLIYAKYPPKFEFKESLKEDLSPEEVGASGLFNDLLQREYEQINQYDSVQITLEDKGDNRFSEVLEYIKDDINIHIGMLQSCLEDLNGSSEQVDQGEQQADQMLGEEMNAENKLTLDEALFESRMDPEKEMILDAIDTFIDLDYDMDPSKFGADSWEDLRDQVEMGIDYFAPEMAGCIKDYLESSIQFNKKHPEMFEEDPGAEIEQDIYDAMEKIISRYE